LAAQAGAMLTFGGFSHTGQPQAHFTIAGLEEQVLLVDGDGQIRYANSSMATLLGAPDKQAVLRTPLAQWELTGALPPGFLSVLIDVTRAAQQTRTTEHEFPDLDAQLEALPPGETPNPTAQTKGRRLRFVSSPVEDRVQVVVQDVTYLRWIESSFQRYVSPSVINKLLEVPPDQLMRTERRQVSVLFTDLRGFSTLCQSEPPDSVCIMLNQHFQHVVDAVQRHNGTIDKLIGDSVMAIFGAPLATGRYALEALLAAVDMLRDHAAWIEGRQAAGWPVLPLSVGIATGDVVVGNVGTKDRLDYTVLGHTVNLASRLVHQAGPGKLLTEPVTHSQALASISAGVPAGISLPRLSFRSVGSLTLKNISNPVEVLEVQH
jgi:class 3 adenylate cyclase